MANRVFIDIGAHAGSTISKVLNSQYKFDRIISVEPDPAMVEKLKQSYADKISENILTISPYAIAESRGTMTLYGSNAGGGASLIAQKLHKSQRTGISVETIRWIDFLDLYELHSADLYVKINCEGGEISIVKSMIEHDRGQIRSMVIDYDIIKSAFGGWKKWASVSQLRHAGIPFLLSEKVFVKGSKRPYIDNWLGSLREFEAPPIKRVPLNLHQFSRIKYIEVISALGIKHDFLKRPRST